MTLRAWELTVLTIAEAAPVDPRRGTAGSPSLQHICFKYLKKTDSGGGCIAWVCTRQQPFHDWTRLQEGYRKFEFMRCNLFYFEKRPYTAPASSLAAVNWCGCAAWKPSSCFDESSLEKIPEQTDPLSDGLKTGNHCGPQRIYSIVRARRSDAEAARADRVPTRVGIRYL